MTDTVDHLDVDSLDTVSEESPTQDVTRPHPETLKAILGITFKIITDDPSADRLEVLYLATKQTIWAKKYTESVQDLAPILFAHYLEAFRALRVLENKQDESKADLNLMLLYNDAALSLFDLYLHRPHDQQVRKLLTLATKSLQQVAVSYHTVHTDRETMDVIGDISTVTMLSETVRDYLKGQKRIRNYDYIRWLKSFFENMIKNPDLSFMKDDVVLKSVLTQVTKRSTVIKVPTPAK